MSNSLAAESVLANVREEIREEVAYALELAVSQSSEEPPQCLPGSGAS